VGRQTRRLQAALEPEPAQIDQDSGPGSGAARPRRRTYQEHPAAHAAAIKSHTQIEEDRRQSEAKAAARADREQKRKRREANRKAAPGEVAALRDATTTEVNEEHSTMLDPRSAAARPLTPSFRPPTKRKTQRRQADASDHSSESEALDDEFKPDDMDVDDEDEVLEPESAPVREPLAVSFCSDVDHTLTLHSSSSLKLSSMRTTGISFYSTLAVCARCSRTYSQIRWTCAFSSSSLLATFLLRLERPRPGRRRRKARRLIPATSPLSTRPDYSWRARVPRLGLAFRMQLLLMVNAVRRMFVLVVQTLTVR
jgi:hypothetical protein